MLVHIFKLLFEKDEISYESGAWLLLTGICVYHTSFLQCIDWKTLVNFINFINYFQEASLLLWWNSSNILDNLGKLLTEHAEK